MSMCFVRIMKTQRSHSGEQSMFFSRYVLSITKNNRSLMKSGEAILSCLMKQIFLPVINIDTVP